MKFILVFILAGFLTSCWSDEDIHYVQQKELKYKAGDLVLMHNEPFYENCFGYIVDFQLERELFKPQKYRVAVGCRSTGMLGRIITVPETDLELKVRAELKTPETGQ